MRHERDMVRSIVAWREGSYRPGVTFDDAALAGLRHPTLMVYGDQDHVGNVDAWKAFVTRLRAAELRILDGRGHMPWLDAPRLVAADVRAFLRAST